MNDNDTVHTVFVSLSGRIIQKIIDSYKHGVVSTPPPPLPGLKLSSLKLLCKTRSCLNIQNILDILDNRHLRV